MKNTTVFISHVHEDDGQVADMTALLAEHGYNVTDSSVTKDEPNRAKDPDYIKREILAPRIRDSDTMVVLVTPGMRESQYVDWEIEYAKQLGIRIVGVWAQNGTEDDIPDALEKAADAVVGWQAERIYGAISGEIDNWEDPKGAVRPPREIVHHKC
jgi:hypothetical protein